MANMNSAQIQQYITQNYPGLGQLTPAQIGAIMNNSQGGNAANIDQGITSSPEYQQYQAGTAQAAYQQGINTAVTGLQGQQTNLEQSYGSLLNDVMGQGTVAMNTATSGENAYLASRGLVSNAGQGNNQLSAQQLAVQQANQAAAGSVGVGSASDINAIQQAIAGIQSGAAGTAEQIPLQYGSYNLASLIAPSQAAANYGQAAQGSAQAAVAPYIAGGSLLFNAATGNLNLLGQNISLSPDQIQAALGKLA